MTLVGPVQGYQELSEKNKSKILKQIKKKTFASEKKEMRK